MSYEEFVKRVKAVSDAFWVMYFMSPQGQALIGLMTLLHAGTSGWSPDEPLRALWRPAARPP